MLLANFSKLSKKLNLNPVISEPSYIRVILYPNRLISEPSYNESSYKEITVYSAYHISLFSDYYLYKARIWNTAWYYFV